MKKKNVSVIIKTMRNTVAKTSRFPVLNNKI